MKDGGGKGENARSKEYPPLKSDLEVPPKDDVPSKKLRVKCFSWL